ncbi:quinolinate synthase NadA [Planctomycetota bacterium]
MKQASLPDKYQQLSQDDALELIAQCKRELADRIVILGHHYQRDEIIQFADFTGDSLKLSQIAAQQKDAEFIIFCGVHFMAESADILAEDYQKVLLPHMDAGCGLAEMADIEQVKQCLLFLQKNLANPEKLIPVTYVNSTAAIKAFCGDLGGLCCTSSNCRAIFESLWEKDPETVILFLPDQHLGRNTAYKMGIELDRMALWNPHKTHGSNSPEQIKNARIILWNGFCCIHQEFSVQQIETARAQNPQVNVIVHPESAFDVAQAADAMGSTEQIIKTVSAAKLGSHWLVGTERNLVERLARKMAPQNIQVRLLTDSRCTCKTMNLIDPPHLAWLLDNLRLHCQNPDSIPVVNQVTVGDTTKHHAKIALDKMLDVTAPAQ